MFFFQSRNPKQQVLEAMVKEFEACCYAVFCLSNFSNSVEPLNLKPGLLRYTGTCRNVQGQVWGVSEVLGLRALAVCVTTHTRAHTHTHLYIYIYYTHTYIYIHMFSVYWVVCTNPDSKTWTLARNSESLENDSSRFRCAFTCVCTSICVV